MKKNCLIVNTGSASKKYSFYIGNEKKYTAHFEKEGSALIVTETISGKKLKKELNNDDYPNSARLVIDSLVESKVLEKESDLAAVGIRVVAPGKYFLETQEISDEYVIKAEETLEKVPLHLAPTLDEIKNLKTIFKNSLPLIAVSDSAFHKNMPEENQLYSIPIEDSRKLGIYRFGYHGISIQSISCQLKTILGEMPSRVVICHLGGGASISAVKNGVSVNNTMGFTPLEGLTMATRVGEDRKSVV